MRSLLLVLLMAGCSGAQRRPDRIAHAPVSAVSEVVEGSSACALSPGETRWIQTSLDSWEMVNVELLDLSPSSLPWIVLFSESCAWHLSSEYSKIPDSRAGNLALTFAGNDVQVRVQPHQGTVWLPSGSAVPAQEMASASLYESKSRRTEPFLVLALPEVWLGNRKELDDSEFRPELLGIFSHEMVHTLQLVEVAKRVEALEKRFTLPESISDDIIEERFKEVPGFRQAHEAETNLLYRATSESEPTSKLALVAEALKIALNRQAKYFTGADAVYRELEGLFLNMEGVAVWAAFELSRSDPGSDIGATDPAATRARNTWSQDEGLALFLLIDDLVPEWKQRVLGPELASPFKLLSEAVGTGGERGSR
ncbi:MAG TPA: hypothetical protein VFI91_11225 [Longimicrobiaceae bacterium]|nr:hypothetical protein [Longimicrobiaceae bacterium]